MVSSTLLLTLVVGAAQAAPFSFSWKQIISPGTPNSPAPLPPAGGNPQQSFAPRISNAPGISNAPMASSSPMISNVAVPRPQTFSVAPLASNAPGVSRGGFGAAPAPAATGAPQASPAPVGTDPAVGSNPRLAPPPPPAGINGPTSVVVDSDAPKSHFRRFISAPWGGRSRKNKVRSEEEMKLQARVAPALTINPQVSASNGFGPRASNVVPNAPRASNLNSNTGGFAAPPAQAPPAQQLPNQGAQTPPPGVNGATPTLAPAPPLAGLNNNEVDTDSSKAEAMISIPQSPWANANLRKPEGSKESEKIQSNPTLGKIFELPENEKSTKQQTAELYDQLSVKSGRQNLTTTIKPPQKKEQGSTKVIEKGGKKNSTMKYEIGYITRKLRH